MNIIDKKSIDQLLEIKETMVVSIYMPTHRYPTSPHVQENMIRFKNSIRKAKEQLESKKIDEITISSINKKLEKLLSNKDFWSKTSEGLALFVTKDKFWYFHLPLECDEYIETGSAANITPLLALSSYNQPYYLLALAVHKPLLYKGDMYGLKKVDVDFPASPEEALNIDEMFSNSNTVRGVSIRGGGNDTLSSHGQGDSREAGNEERLKYFRIIDNKIITHKTIDKDLPLLITGTDDEISEYRANSQYKHIVKAHINGNHTETDERELQSLAWPVIQSECCNKEHEALADSFKDRQGIGKSSSDLEEIEEAVRWGRVDALLLELITSTRDTISDVSKPIVKIIFPSEMNAAINTLAIATHRQGGRIIALMGQAMPATTVLAAVYRY